MSQFPPGPPPQNPEGQPPPGSPPPGWGQPPPGTPPPPGGPPPGYPPTGGVPGAPGGPPSGPGWGGQQPYPPATPPSGGGGGNGLKILIGVAVLAILGIGAFFVLGGSDDSGGGGGNSPESAVKAFFSAAAKGDCEGMFDRISDASLQGFGKDAALAACKESIKAGDTPFGGENASLDSVKVKEESGDTATVTVKSTTDGQQSTEDIKVVKEDGKWKIDLSALTGTGSVSPGDDSSDVTDTTFVDPTDTSIDLGDFDLPEECQDPTSPDFDYEACAEALGNG